MLGAAPKESPVLRLPFPRKWASSLTMAVASHASRPPNWFHTPSLSCAAEGRGLKPKLGSMHSYMLHGRWHCCCHDSLHDACILPWDGIERAAREQAAVERFRGLGLGAKGELRVRFKKLGQGLGQGLRSYERAWWWAQRWLSTASQRTLRPAPCSAATHRRSASSPPYELFRLYRSRGLASKRGRY